MLSPDLNLLLSSEVTGDGRQAAWAPRQGRGASKEASLVSDGLSPFSGGSTLGAEGVEEGRFRQSLSPGCSQPGGNGAAVRVNSQGQKTRALLFTDDGTRQNGRQRQGSGATLGPFSPPPITSLPAHHPVIPMPPVRTTSFRNFAGGPC